MVVGGNIAFPPTTFCFLATFDIKRDKKAMAISVLSDITVPTPSTANSALSFGYADENYADVTSIVPAYDPTKVYRMGSIVSYEGKIYQCTVTTATGEFDSEDWGGGSGFSLITNNLNGYYVTSTTFNNRLIPTSLEVLSVTSSLTVPTPTNDTHAATKKYVDDGLFGAGSLLRYKREPAITASSAYFSSTSTAKPLTLGSGYIGWILSFPKTGNQLTQYITLPDIQSLYTEDDYTSFAITYEAILLVKTNTEQTAPDLRLHFMPNGSTSDITWMNSDGENFENGYLKLKRGFAYFLAFRSYSYGISSTSYAHTWIGNVQGSVALPTS